MSGRFELRRDEDTGRLYWFGSEDDWKDATEVGEDGVLTLSAEHFKVGTVLQFTEPITLPRNIAEAASGIASSIAVAVMEEHVRAGGTVEFPSLGITLTAADLKERTD